MSGIALPKYPGTSDMPGKLPSIHPGISGMSGKLPSKHPSTSGVPRKSPKIPGYVGYDPSGMPGCVGYCTRTRYLPYAENLRKFRKNAKRIREV